MAGAEASVGDLPMPVEQLINQFIAKETEFARARELPAVRVMPSMISVPGARAFVLEEDAARGPDEAFMVGREFAHVHPADDGSLHIDAAAGPRSGGRAAGMG